MLMTMFVVAVFGQGLKVTAVDDADGVRRLLLF